MSLDNVFDEANKRRTALARDEAERAGKQIANQKSELEKRRDNAVRIDNWLRSAHNYIVATHYAAVKANGYDIQHQYELTPTIPGQTYCRLELFMQRGGVVHVFGAGGPGYEADHSLLLAGDESSGDIKVSLISRIGNTTESRESFHAEAPPVNDDLDSMFEYFVKRSIELEDWRTGSASR